MIIKENSEMISVHFDSMVDLMQFKPEVEKNKQIFDGYINGKSRRHYRDAWLGKVTTSKEIVNMALLGDKETYKVALGRMEKFNSDRVSSASQHVQKIKRIKTRSDMGDELDIHKVYQGNLSHAWSKTKRIEVDVKHHLVTIFLNINGNGMVKVADTIWRCALILKLVKEIQLAGKSVKIVVGGMVCNAMIQSSKKLTTSITVKKYNETLSPERLAAMTNIGFYRVFGFAAKECQHNNVYSSGGQPLRINNSKMTIHLQEEVDKGHTKPIFLDRILNEHDAIRELKNAFQQMKSFT